MSLLPKLQGYRFSKSGQWPSNTGQGSNNEFHLLMKCILMIPARLEIKLRNGRSLESTLIELQARSQDEIEVARMFLSQDKELQRTDMIERGLVLDMLVDKFYLE